MNKIISDISDYIFISDEPEKVDAIFLPGATVTVSPALNEGCCLPVANASSAILIKSAISLMTF